MQQQAQPWQVEWVATPPTPSRPAAADVAPTANTRYTGPPSYPAVPRWGFPILAWRRPTVLPHPALSTRSSAERLRTLASTALALLLVTGVTAGLAAIAELWRYILLWISQSALLSPGVVHVSTVAVTASAVMALLTGAAAGACLLFWFLRARQIAADVAGLAPSRPTWQVLLGLLLPGVNLIYAGQVLTELEHTVLRRRHSTRRPRPSRLVGTWWAVWAGNGLLAGLTVLWQLRDSLQAQADAVLLHGLTNLSAVAVAVLTARLVATLTGLLSPVDPTTMRRSRVVRVNNAEEPQLRPAHPTSRR
ncbi:hypothetical protein GCM10012275_53770 [Longimycelium tulufanense]|uniref:DUF4328 domain-containing protein n=1 Tax=Longimycelium tulufanense TaxID=907463 RepID=A0A8J3CJ58_9PSEU|nr:DUF4328 domain-containing protein [Longimycelium tulufanense]GGM76260.1 hypothetical protein GCM10012275_53770 [Longimycelium tulufanense]